MFGGIDVDKKRQSQLQFKRQTWNAGVELVSTFTWKALEAEDGSVADRGREEGFVSTCQARCR